MRLTETYGEMLRRHQIEKATHLAILTLREGSVARAIRYTGATISSTYDAFHRAGYDPAEISRVARNRRRKPDCDHA